MSDLMFWLTACGAGAGLFVLVILLHWLWYRFVRRYP